MNRRHFLGAIIASACAPAIVRASSLMPVRKTVLVPGYKLIGRVGTGRIVDWNIFYETVAVNNAYLSVMIGEQMRETLERNALMVLRCE